jgi:hypothetical protein
VAPSPGVIVGVGAIGIVGAAESVSTHDIMLDSYSVLSKRFPIDSPKYDVLGGLQSESQSSEWTMPMSVSGFVPAGVQCSIMSSSSLPSLIIEHFAFWLTIVIRNQKSHSGTSTSSNAAGNKESIPML